MLTNFSRTLESYGVKYAFTKALCAEHEFCGWSLPDFNLNINYSHGSFVVYEAENSEEPIDEFFDRPSLACTWVQNLVNKKAAH